MALYRRYRPQTFQEVIGQEHVTRPIMAALRADRTAHAYLFSGPRGCGKTTSARILARCLNCVEAPTDTPCGVCESCRELSLGGGGSLDVVEMDAASHGGVDDARELIERAAFAPARDRYKIFIIDEAHMVSNQGFNALLKLVEEPPPHVKFVFATTEPEKVIGTIRSRTHHYPFRLVPPETLENYMAGICDEEGIEVGGGVLPLVVRAGGGSVRDSLSVLDQLMGGSDGGELDYAHAIALLGYTDGSLLDDAVEAIAARDGSTLFAVVERVVQSGHDPRRFVEDMLQRLRDLIVIALAGEEADDALVSVPRDQYQRMVNQAEHLGARGASRSADLTNEALSGMVGATSPRLQLELLCARLLLPAPEAPGAAAAAGSEGARAEGRAAGSGDANGLGANARGAQAGEGRRGAPGVADSDAGNGHGGGARNGGSGASRTPRPNEGGETDGRADVRFDGDADEARRPAGPPARPASAQRQPRPQRGGSGPFSGRGISPTWAAGADDGPDEPTRSRAPQRDKPRAGAGNGSAAANKPAAAETAAGGNEAAAQERKPGEESGIPPVRESAGASREGVQSASGDAAIVRQRWAEVAAAVARSSKSTAALIDERNAMVAGIRDGVLGLQFRTAGLATTFNDRDHARRVASALHDVLGLSLRVRGLVGGDAGPKAPPARSRAERPEQARRPASQAPSQSAPQAPSQSVPQAPSQSVPQAPPPLVPPRPASAVPQSQPRSERSEPDEPPESENPASSETRSPNSPETDRRAPKPAPRAAETKRGAEKAQPSEGEWRPSPDMEERGLVLSSDRVEIPEGPRPTRDQLASALRELESEQAARASGRPADASSPEGQKPSPGGRASASEEGTPGSPVPEAASDPRAAEEIPDPDAPDAADMRVIRPESPEGGAGDDADVAPKAHGRSALPAQPETARTASRGSGSTATGEPVPAAQTRAEPVPAAHAELDPAARAEPVSAARAKTARGSDAFGGLPEPVELDDEPDPYFSVPEPQPFGGAAAADGRGSEDPAGVLAQLLDGDGRGVKRAAPASDTASPFGSVSPSVGAASSASGATSSAGGSSPSSPSPIPSPSGPGSSPSSPGPGSSQAGAASPSESDDVPFYEQRMPMPQRPRNAEKQAGPGERARRPEQRTPVPQRPRSGGAAPRGAASISERIMAAHGQERQKPRVESAAVDDGESDVSLSDPTISQSKLVGLDVVLSTFDGTIIEEIARTDGGN